jgi:hypothetical protein
MSNQSDHRITAIKWLKSSAKMAELFRLESEIVIHTAKYNLAKAKESPELVTIVTDLHNLIDDYERVICGNVQLSLPEANKTNNELVHSHQQLDIAHTLGCKMQSTVESTPKAHSVQVTLPKALQDSVKPNNWNTLSLEDRIAHRQATEHSNVEPEPIAAPEKKKSIISVDKASRDIVAAISDDKFDLSGRGYDKNEF